MNIGTCNMVASASIIAIMVVIVAILKACSA